jgi:hypothetical protein
VGETRPQGCGDTKLKLILSALILFAIATISCAPADDPTPTPTATPDFSKGEAIAVVKTWLSGMTYTITRQLQWPGPPRTSRGCEGHRNQRKKACIEESNANRLPLSTSTHNCLTMYQKYEWENEYLGDGKWLVTAQTSDSQGGTLKKAQWHVFESSLAVNPIEPKGRCS